MTRDGSLRTVKHLLRVHLLRLLVVHVRGHGAQGVGALYAVQGSVLVLQAAGGVVHVAHDGARRVTQVERPAALNSAGPHEAVGAVSRHRADLALHLLSVQQPEGDLLSDGAGVQRRGKVSDLLLRRRSSHALVPLRCNLDLHLVLHLLVHAGLQQRKGGAALRLRWHRVGQPHRALRAQQRPEGHDYQQRASSEGSHRMEGSCRLWI
mmetsp:Transcript_28719/g.61855  ORF Transcript_28719/g.61855 Transcript_28719/m.61855 type:complete len:208 (-) Transcript_28719:140-763(-)